MANHDIAVTANNMPYKIPIKNYSISPLALDYNNSSGYLTTSVHSNQQKTFSNSLRNTTSLSKVAEKNFHDNFGKRKVKTVKSFSVILEDKISKMRVSNPKKTGRFLSGVQLTLLVQKYLARSMKRGGIAAPPDLTYRTGEHYVRSIEVYPNYRKRLISYMYNPIYESLEPYGYDTAGQTENAIRSVLQAYYLSSDNFNLRKVRNG